jgi:8-oxo-dGTP diphosphatase
MRILTTIHDVHFLPKPSELRLVLADELPPIERITGAFALVFVGDQMLMTKLRDQTRGWDIPGGGVEPGETPEEAMRREVHEEAGAKLGPARPFAYQEVRLLGRKPKGYASPYPDSYMVFYRAQLLSLEPFTGDEETEGRGLLPPNEARTTLWVQRNQEFYEVALADAEASEPARRVDPTEHTSA